MPSFSDLVDCDACSVVGRLRRGEVTPRQLLDVLEAHIAPVSNDLGLHHIDSPGRRRD